MWLAPWPVLKAKSGMGKTAVFVLACLQTLDVSQQASYGWVGALVCLKTTRFRYQSLFGSSLGHRFLGASTDKAVVGEDDESDKGPH